jgi:hypothetical protein
LATASIVKEILQRELGMRKFSRRLVHHSLSDTQNFARVEPAKEMLRILQKSETNDFDGITRGGESWFQPTTASSKMFARSAVAVISRKRQTVGATETMITVFFTAERFILFDVLLRGNTLNQLYRVSSK